jgi:hypothetical protein
VVSNKLANGFRLSACRDLAATGGAGEAVVGHAKASHLAVLEAIFLHAKVAAIRD